MTTNIKEIAESDLHYDLKRFFDNCLNAYMLRITVNTPKFVEQHYFDRCQCAYDMLGLSDIKIDKKTANVWIRIQYRHKKNICDF